ncbi:hypothetical protein DFS34DRAFT_99737 [Phlyctochytrium arcticum]|nr:hypothetical protein DFS34DRAFT_99737 [Phlyctochytrium arcticum]
MVAEDLVNNLRNELAEARQALKDSKELFDEFHEESKLLEAELEREAEDLRIKHATLAKEHELLKRKFSDLQSQTNKDASAMQKELDALRASDKSQRETITTLEIQNEELEQVSRNATASAESVKEHYSQLLERAALLEQELENRSELQDDNQRLKDDVRGAQGFTASVKGYR